MSSWEEFGKVEWSEELGILEWRELGSMDGRVLIFGVSRLVQGVEWVEKDAGILGEFGAWIWKDLKDCGGLDFRGKEEEEEC